MDEDNNAIMGQIASRGNVWRDESGEDSQSGTSSIGPERLGQSVGRQGASAKTDCAALHNNATSGSVRAVVLVARAHDDGSEVTCLATSALIPSHGESLSPLRPHYGRSL